MKKLSILLFALFLVSCEKGETREELESSLESALGVIASKSPLGGNDLFFKM